MNRRFLMLVYMVALVSATHAQTVIKGNVKEKTATGNLDLPFVNVFVEGTTIGVASGMDGNYELILPEPGTHMISFSFMGFKKQSVEVETIGNEAFTFNIVMEADGETLGEVKVQAKANRESESMLLLEQKKASIAVEAIGARELSIKGVSDAGSAVTKVTGISKQEGSGTLNVRGLGDRYNTTTFNKLPIPTNNAEVKNIDLGLFSTDVLSFINIEKTYNAPLYGDFGGANIDIVSKKLTGDGFLEFDVKTSQNSSLFGLENFYLTDGPTSSGFYNSDVPDISAIRDKSDYSFTNSWDPVKSNLNPNIGVGVSGGKSFEIGSGKLNTFLTFSYNNEKSYTERIEKMVSATGFHIMDMNGEEFKYNTQTTGMLNLNYEMENSNLYFNSLVMNTSEESLTTITGRLSGEITHGLKRRGEFIRNLIAVNQLLGDHDLNNNWSVDWGVGYNYIKNSVPDRKNSVFQSYDDDTNIGELEIEGAGSNFRYYHEFDENEIAANFALHKKIGVNEEDNTYNAKLSVGYSGKFKQRDFDNYVFNHTAGDAYVDVDLLDTYFNNENFVSKEFSVAIASPKNVEGEKVDGEHYVGKVNVHSGYGLYEKNFGPRLMMLLGLRVENVHQEISTIANQIIGEIPGTNQKTFDFDKLQFLPSLSLKYNLKPNQNLRFATSKTYTLPQMQEMPFMSFIGLSDAIFGNPWLSPSDVYNADIKWEVFPKRGQLFSVTGFGKYIIDPINKTSFGGFDGQYVNANTGDWAYVYGLELDLKTDLLKTTKNRVFTSGNLSLMKTLTELNGEKMKEETENNFTANFNSSTSALQGAAPLLANVSLGYARTWSLNSLSAVFVYNYTSDRLYAFGQDHVGDEYLEALNTLDLVLKTKFNKLSVELAAKNLFDAEYKRVVKNRIEENQDHVIRQYKKGILYSASVKYRF